MSVFGKFAFELIWKIGPNQVPNIFAYACSNYKCISMSASLFRPLHKVPEIFSVVAWISSLLFFCEQKCSL